MFSPLIHVRYLNRVNPAEAILNAEYYAELVARAEAELHAVQTVRGHQHTRQLRPSRSIASDE